MANYEHLKIERELLEKSDSYVGGDKENRREGERKNGNVGQDPLAELATEVPIKSGKKRPALLSRGPARRGRTSPLEPPVC